MINDELKSKKLSAPILNVEIRKNFIGDLLSRTNLEYSRIESSEHPDNIRFFHVITKSPITDVLINTLKEKKLNMIGVFALLENREPMLSIFFEYNGEFPE
jgi:hypothetical protein